MHKFAMPKELDNIKDHLLLAFPDIFMLIYETEREITEERVFCHRHDYMLPDLIFLPDRESS